MSKTSYIHSPVPNAFVGGAIGALIGFFLMRWLNRTIKQNDIIHPAAELESQATALMTCFFLALGGYTGLLVRTTHRIAGADNNIGLSSSDLLFRATTTGMLATTGTATAIALFMFALTAETPNLLALSFIATALGSYCSNQQIQADMELIRQYRINPAR